MAEVTEANIRLLAWDQGGTPLLSTEDINLIIGMAGGVLERAVALAWAVKGGYYAQMIDITESGSVRRLNQLYKNAERQWEIWDKKAAGIEEVIGTTALRVPPQGFCIFEEAVDWSNRVSMFSPNEPVNVRTYPLYRMPAILGA